MSYLLLLLLALPAKAQTPPHPGFWVNAYYGAWMQAFLPPSAIDFTAFTRLIHFGLFPRPDGSVDRDINQLTPSHVAQTVALAAAAGKPVSIALGGWQSRNAFIAA